MVNQAQTRGMEQINNLVYYDSNSDEDDEDNISHDNIQGKADCEFDRAIDDTTNDVHGEPINNKFLHPVGQHKGTTGTMIKRERIAYVQYCLCGELY